MRGRIGVLTCALSLVAMAATAPTSARAATDKTWCMTYCDVIHLGCQKTLGWFDTEACDEWKKGCLDGCKVND